MLHALRAKKLLLDQSEPWRLEDGLTSMIFGTLLAARAVNVCNAWLLNQHQPDSHDGLRMWFWPRLPFAEPDVIVKIGNRMVVIEAKYGSGKHGHDDQETPSESVNDQLIRQVDSIIKIRDRTGSTTPDLAKAIENSEVIFAYLVDARRSANARKEFNESKSKSPCKDMLFITWQDLFRVLKTHHNQDLQWIGDMCDVLELLGLDDFLGRWECRPFCSRPIFEWAERKLEWSVVSNALASKQIVHWRVA